MHHQRLPGYHPSGAVYRGLQAGVTTPLLLLVPVISCLVAGRRWGLYWSGIVAITVCALYIIHELGVQLPQTILPDHRISIYLVVWLLSLSVLIICLYIYEFQLEDLKRKLSSQSKQFAYEAQHDALTGLSNRCNVPNYLRLIVST